MMAIIRRTFQHLNEETFIPLYKALVRTHLEYASSVWAPYKKGQIDRIEAVQRRATKQISGLCDLSYTERLRRLGLPTLSYRRLRGDMVQVFNVVRYVHLATSSTSKRKKIDFHENWHT